MGRLKIRKPSLESKAARKGYVVVRRGQQVPRNRPYIVVDENGLKIGHGHRP